MSQLEQPFTASITDMTRESLANPNGTIAILPTFFPSAVQVVQDFGAVGALVSPGYGIILSLRTTLNHVTIQVSEGRLSTGSMEAILVHYTFQRLIFRGTIGFYYRNYFSRTSLQTLLYYRIVSPTMKLQN